MLFSPFLILDFLIPAVITQIFNPSAEFVVPIGMLIGEAKADIEKSIVMVKQVIGQNDLKLCNPFYVSY